VLAQSRTDGGFRTPAAGSIKREIANSSAADYGAQRQIGVRSGAADKRARSNCRHIFRDECRDKKRDGQEQWITGKGSQIRHGDADQGVQ
jgi:hypothetical protein